MFPVRPAACRCQGFTAQPSLQEFSCLQQAGQSGYQAPGAGGSAYGVSGASSYPAAGAGRGAPPVRPGQQRCLACDLLHCSFRRHLQPLTFAVSRIGSGTDFSRGFDDDHESRAARCRIFAHRSSDSPDAPHTPQLLATALVQPPCRGPAPPQPVTPSVIAAVASQARHPCPPTSGRMQAEVRESAA